jgi:hypothetical protein
MEESHSVDKGEGKKLEWHAGHETWDDAFAHRKDLPDGFGAFGATAGTIVERSTLKGVVTGALLGGPAGAALAGREALATAAKIALSGPALVIGGTAVAVTEWGSASARGEGMKHASDLDAMDLGTTAVLDLDTSFKQAEFAKHPGIVPEKLVTYLMADPQGRAEIPALQASADVGSRAAFDAIRCGGPAEYFRLHPDAAKRFDDDVAFNKGFEYVTWSASQPDGEARTAAIRAKLDERDARANVSLPVHG